MKPTKSLRVRKVAVYLDTNVFCRPFDYLTDRKIFQEASAVAMLIELCESNVIEVHCSEVLLTELSNIEDAWKRGNAEALVVSLCAKAIAHSNKTEVLADGITKTGIDYVDSLHVASACISGAEYFVTCDDEMISKSGIIQKVLKERGFKVKIENPKAFISHFKHNKTERVDS